MCICSDTLEDECFLYEGMEQYEGLVLDTADAAASRLSAEHMQKNLVLPFPQAAYELQSSCLQPASPHYSAQLRTGNRASTVSPPLGPLPGQRGTADWRASACSPQSHQGAAGRRMSFEGAKVSLCSSGAPWLHNGAMDTVYAPPTLNYLDRS